MSSTSPLGANIPKTLTLATIADGLDDGRFTVVELVQAHLDRITRFNPVVHAVIEVNPAALLIADALDEERKHSGRRGLLHGVPILIKDNVVTSENMSAAAGSLALVGAKPATESPVVTSLRAAGCVILGSANMSEWANFRSKVSDSGWSARGGQCYAAYHEDQTPGGSSSGSGVGVDLGLCVLAVGSETSGSIISPSNASGVVGIKPTVGLTSRTSVIPISPEMDTLGPMARNVEDAAAMLSAMAGRDPKDSKTALIPFDSTPDYRAMCRRAAGPAKYKLGVPRHTFDDVPAPILAAFETLVAKLQAQGVTVVDCEFSGLATYLAMTADDRCDFMAGQFAPALAAYCSSLATNPHGITGLAAAVEYTRATEAEECAARPVDRFEQSLAVAGATAAYAAAVETRAFLAGEGGIQATLDADALDALLLPTEAYAANYLAGVGGNPQVAVPLGYLPDGFEVARNDTGRLVAKGPNVPYTVSVVGARFSEENLVGIAALVERLTQARAHAEEHRLPRLRN